MTKLNRDVLAGAVDSLKIACKILRDDLAAANQQIDALRAERDRYKDIHRTCDCCETSVEEGNTLRCESCQGDAEERLTAERDAMRAELEKEKEAHELEKRAHERTWNHKARVIDELAALRQSTEADAERARHLIAAAWSDPAPVAPEPAPSPSARKACSFCQDEEPRILNGDNSASVCGYCAGLHWDICRPDDPPPVARADASVVWAASWSDPPDLAAEIAKLRKERDDLYQRAATDVHEACRLDLQRQYARNVAELTAEIARLMMEKERKQHLLDMARRAVADTRVHAGTDYVSLADVEATYGLADEEYDPEAIETWRRHVLIALEP